jgi:hypothetical protein
LIARLDQLSMDEIVQRIERLPVAQQQQLLTLLVRRFNIAW